MCGLLADSAKADSAEKNREEGWWHVGQVCLPLSNQHVTSDADAYM